MVVCFGNEYHLHHDAQESPIHTVSPHWLLEHEKAHDHELSETGHQHCMRDQIFHAPEKPLRQVGKTSADLPKKKLQRNVADHEYGQEVLEELR